MADVLFVAGFLSGEDLRGVNRLADRLAQRGIASRLLCSGGTRGVQGAVEVPGLLDRWRRPWQLRRLEPPPSAVALLHGLGVDTAEAVLDLAERWSRPYVLNVEDYLAPGRALRLSRRWCHGLIVPSADVASDFAESMGFPARHVNVVLPALEIPPHLARSSARRGVPIVAAAGSAEEGDGLGVFFEAARRVLDRDIDAEFVVDAPRSAESGLRRLAKYLGVDDRVTFADPAVSDPAYWSLMDVFCLPSLVPDPGRSLAEAMAHGVPCVASDVRSLRAWVADGETGRLVPPGDAAALAEAIVSLLRSPEEAKTLGDQARAFVLTRCDPEYETDQLALLYQRVLAEAEAGPIAWEEPSDARESTAS